MSLEGNNSRTRTLCLLAACELYGRGTAVMVTAVSGANGVVCRSWRPMVWAVTTIITGRTAGTQSVHGLHGSRWVRACASPAERSCHDSGWALGAERPLHLLSALRKIPPQPPDRPALPVVHIPDLFGSPVSSFTRCWRPSACPGPVTVRPEACCPRRSRQPQRPQRHRCALRAGRGKGLWD